MKYILLTPSELLMPLVLSPKEDTLYCIPQELATACITLTMEHPGVRAFVVGLFHTTSEQNITVEQKHFAPQTESHILLKSLVASSGKFSYQGTISIEREAISCNASQEARGLLQGSGARFTAIPSLEILPKEVLCTHKASSAPINADSLFILQTKGFSEEEAKSILENAFLSSALDTLRTWNIPEEICLLAEEQIAKNH